MQYKRIREILELYFNLNPDNRELLEYVFRVFRARKKHTRDRKFRELIYKVRGKGFLSINDMGRILFPEQKDSERYIRLILQGKRGIGKKTFERFKEIWFSFIINGRKGQGHKFLGYYGLGYWKCYNADMNEEFNFYYRGIISDYWLDVILDLYRKRDEQLNRLIHTIQISDSEIEIFGEEMYFYNVFIR